jgi:uncharacterized membrane protein
MQDLGTLPGDNSSAAVAVNACSRAMGHSALTAGGKMDAFLGMPAVRLSPGGPGSDAVAINDLGKIVGSGDSGDVTKPHAVLWKQRGIRFGFGNSA